MKTSKIGKGTFKEMLYNWKKQGKQIRLRKRKENKNETDNVDQVRGSSQCIITELYLKFFFETVLFPPSSLTRRFKLQTHFPDSTT